MTVRRTCLVLVTGLALLSCIPALAGPVFNSSEIEGKGAEIIWSDLDGNGLKDAVLVDGPNLSIYYQDAKQGFSHQPPQKVILEDCPSLIWTARLGGKAESLLVMSADGVKELNFASRTNSPTIRQIIRQQTIIPASVKETQVICFPLSAETGTDWPLLLVPVAGGLQVWKHQDEWRQVQFIEHAMDNHIQPSMADPGYSRLFRVSLCIADVNGDGREDLMFRRNDPGGVQTYELHLQTADGLFAREPAMTYTNRTDGWTSLKWLDINRDGRVDLIKSTASQEPSFIPGFRSSKVWVAIYLADQQGRIPPEPDQIFRKDDWSAALPMTDVDGDGYPDLVLGYMMVDSREGLRKAIIAEQADLNLKFHFYRPGIGFLPDPDCQRNLLLHFHQAFNINDERRLYYERFVSLNGDFNGDGKKDLLARDRSDGISVYFFISREQGFSAKADLCFHCPEPIEWWDVRDLNGDGISDLVVKLEKQDKFRIFISQRK